MVDVDDIDFTDGGVTFRVSGLRKAVRNLQAAGVDAQDISSMMEAAGEIVAGRSRTLAPVKSGKLRASIRVGKGKTKAVVRVGSASAFYARFVYFGKSDVKNGPLYANANPFVYDALTASRIDVFNKVETGMTDLLRKNDLL